MSTSSISPALRIAVEEKFQGQCCYCRTQRLISGVSLTLDHIIPESKEGETTFQNLCLACWDCNLAKGVRTHGYDSLTQTLSKLFDPQQEQWAEHFCWSDDATLVIGLTAKGRATVKALKLNRIQLIESRRVWVEMAWHPPRD